jgi:hypothetical protein
MESAVGKILKCILIGSIWIFPHEIYSQGVTKVEKLVTKCMGGEKDACNKLITIAKNDSNPQNQCLAINSITDQSILIDIVRQTNNQQVSLTALDKITDQPFLVEFTNQNINTAGLHALRNVNDLEKSKILLSKFIKRYDSSKDSLREIKSDEFFYLDSDPGMWAYEPVFKKYFKKIDYQPEHKRIWTNIYIKS